MKRLGNDQRPNSLQPIAYSLQPRYSTPRAFFQGTCSLHPVLQHSNPLRWQADVCAGSRAGSSPDHSRMRTREGEPGESLLFILENS